MPDRLLKLHPEGLTLCGVHLSQTWADLYIWEKVLNQIKPARVVELGTLYGGFSVWLEMQARVRNFDFYTFDNTNYLKVNFITNYILADIFGEGRDQVTSLIEKEGRMILFCDNGNKTVEAETFAPFLKKDDVIAVHDWQTECCSVPDSLTLYEPEPNVYEELQSMTRFFTK